MQPVHLVQRNRLVRLQRAVYSGKQRQRRPHHLDSSRLRLEVLEIQRQQRPVNLMHCSQIPVAHYLLD